MLREMDTDRKLLGSVQSDEQEMIINSATPKGNKAFLGELSKSNVEIKGPGPAL